MGTNAYMSQVHRYKLFMKTFNVAHKIAILLSKFLMDIAPPPRRETPSDELLHRYDSSLQLASAVLISGHDSHVYVVLHESLQERCKDSMGIIPFECCDHEDSIAWRGRWWWWWGLDRQHSKRTLSVPL